MWKRDGPARTVSSSFPSVEGSGIGPSITHRLDSYLVRMKFSIFLDHYEPPKISKRTGDRANSRIGGNMTRRQFSFPVPNHSTNISQRSHGV